MAKNKITSKRIDQMVLVNKILSKIENVLIQESLIDVKRILKNIEYMAKELKNLI